MWMGRSRELARNLPLYLNEFQNEQYSSLKENTEASESQSSYSACYQTRKKAKIVEKAHQITTQLK